MLSNGVHRDISYGNAGELAIVDGVRVRVSLASVARKRRYRSRPVNFQTMATPLPSGTYRAENASLAESAFIDVNLERSKFHDVNLRGADFDDVALTGARIHNACLGDVSISNANYTGMTIDGILVTELLRVYRDRNP